MSSTRGEQWLRSTISKIRSKCSWYGVYLTVVSTAGILALFLGFGDFLNSDAQLHSALIILLTMVSAVVTTSVSISKNAGITYHISPAVSMAATPTLGVGIAILAITAANVCTWIVKPADERVWKKTLPQLAFNVGMHNIAIACAGYAWLHIAHWLTLGPFWNQLLAWLAAALIFEEVNLWLLIGVLRLQNGSQFNLWRTWQEEWWATQIGAVSMALGGAVLAYAIERYGWQGIMVFYLPILLSAYAFRLYVREMQSHLANLEEIVAERTRDLREMSRQKDAFLAVLTHDMTTPLANIQISAEIIQGDRDISEENRYLAQLILRSQNKLYEMVRTILDLERLQMGNTLPTEKTLFDLNELLAENVAFVASEAREKGVDLHYQAIDAPLLLNADRRQIERVLLNLMNNAIKYTPRDGAVRVRADARDQSIVVEVEDTGYGIPAEELPIIFEPFQRAQQLEDKATGAGLGLSITKGLVEEHGGTIRVQSEVGVGTTFTIQLPRAVDAAQSVGSVARDEVDESENNAGNKDFSY